jgi:hypothetical protein
MSINEFIENEILKGQRKPSSWHNSPVDVEPNCLWFHSSPFPVKISAFDLDLRLWNALSELVGGELTRIRYKIESFFLLDLCSQGQKKKPLSSLCYYCVLFLLYRFFHISLDLAETTILLVSAVVIIGFFKPFSALVSRKRLGRRMEGFATSP